MSPSLSPQSSRRAFLRAATLALPVLPLLHHAPAGAASAARDPAPSLERLKTEVLDLAYLSAGPEEGRPVVLLHDFGYGIESFAQVVPLLTAAGIRVLAPQLRGHGTTRFRDPATPRSGQQAALGKDLFDFLDAMHIPEAVFAGFGWGAHAAYAMSIVRPTRCVGLVLGGIERIDEAGPLERYLHASERGRRVLAGERLVHTRALWRRLSPRARLDEALLERTAASLDNPDYVDILVHAWRSRHASAAPDPRYASLERRFPTPPRTAVASISLTGNASGVAPAATAGIAFAGAHESRTLAGVGHHLPFEAPQAFAGAALDLVRNGKWRT